MLQMACAILVVEALSLGTAPQKSTACQPDVTGLELLQLVLEPLKFGHNHRLKTDLEWVREQ